MPRRKKKRPWFRRLIGLLFKIAALLVVLSVALTLLLRWIAPPTSAYMTQQRLSGIVIDYRWVPLKRMSPYAPLAVIASEDQKFFKHRGVDFGAIGDAIEERRTRNRVRGASTISQQVAKNLFLWQGKSYLRKGIEVYFTLIMELLWPKQRILEVYLNIAEMGGGVFGTEAAAGRYFGKSAKRLSRREAATLAAVLPNPKGMFADRPSDYVRSRARDIMKQMEALGGVGFLLKEGLFTGKEET